MSKTNIIIKVVNVSTGAFWQDLDQVIKDTGAICLGGKKYQFFTHGDAIRFTHICDDNRLKYEIFDKSTD